MFFDQCLESRKISPTFYPRQCGTADKIQDELWFGVLRIFVVNLPIIKGFAMLQLVSHFRPSFYAAHAVRQAATQVPQLASDVIEEAERFVLRFDLPGIAPENVDLQISHNVLTIKAVREQATLPEGARWLRTERPNGVIEREFKLPDSIDSQSITAKHQHGVLEIVLNKRAEITPRKIAIAA
jgi:HSP20 family protein